jgi:hypothetical protein
MSMTREELIALRDAIDMTLALPDSLRELLAQWLAPEASKPNGHDRSPPTPTPSTPRPVTPIPPRVKAEVKHDNPAHARAAERKLLAAMRERPGLSATLLAKAVGAGLSTTKERLRRMGAQELIEKAPRRPLAGEGRGAAPDGGGAHGAPYDTAVELTAEEKPGPLYPQPAVAHAPWISAALMLRSARGPRVPDVALRLRADSQSCFLRRAS